MLADAPGGGPGLGRGHPPKFWRKTVAGFINIWAASPGLSLWELRRGAERMVLRGEYPESDDLLLEIDEALDILGLFMEAASNLIKTWARSRVA